MCTDETPIFDIAGLLFILTDFSSFPSVPPDNSGIADYSYRAGPLPILYNSSFTKSFYHRRYTVWCITESQSKQQ
jgi:hypothetical protein